MKYRTPLSVKLFVVFALVSLAAWFAFAIWL